jgi:DNA-binding transcriptional regulator LsrR (DeoR family)
MIDRTEPDATPLDASARAGWMYYVAGLTQDQIATELGVSRQRAQRLVSRAMAEGLIHVRLSHRIGACMAMEADLTRRYDLQHCRVAPALGAGSDPARSTAAAAAELLEHFLSREDPQVIAFGTGRSLSAMVTEVNVRQTEQHRIVSLVGNIAPDGSASFFDVIMRMADKLHAQHYPMLTPVLCETAAERALFRSLRPVQAVVRLAQFADVTFVGVGQMGADAPIYKDGFVTHDQLVEMQDKGAVGEIVSGVYDATGTYIETPVTSRLCGIRVEPGRNAPVIAVAAGPTKVAAIRGALRGRIINGLVTDEATATALLNQPES